MLKMPFNDLPIMQEKFKAIKNQMNELESQRFKMDSIQKNVIEAQDAVNQGDLQSLQRLKEAYKNVLSESENEETLLRSILILINEMRVEKRERGIQTSSNLKEAVRRGALFNNLAGMAKTLPLFVSKNKEKAPPLCGGRPAEKSHICKKGDMVVALIVNKEIIWMLAEVVSYNPRMKTYEVMDIDELQKDKRYTVPKNYVAPLPTMRANPETDEEALHQINAEVLALYPNATCLYPAKIEKLPLDCTDPYQVLFEDHNYKSGYSGPEDVEQQYCIAFNETLKVALVEVQKKCGFDAPSKNNFLATAERSTVGQ